MFSLPLPLPDLLQDNTTVLVLSLVVIGAAGWLLQRR
jgi:hypothetical protein